jgi:hypothetical protein
MKILTDDPDWARDIYEARALAVLFVRKYGRSVQGGPCIRATGSGLTVLHHPSRSPVHLTVDTRYARVLSLEWKDGHAWRMEIETYQSGRWESRLRAMVYSRPWLEQFRSILTFTGSLPNRPSSSP